MLNTEYLYNINPKGLEDKLYFEALEYKLEKGKKLYSELYDAKDKESQNRKFYVYKAIEHTRKLIEEKEQME